MDSCNTCGNSYDRCPDVLSGRCVSYQGAPIPCLKLCTGDSISYIQEQVALKLCELVGLTDMSGIIIPPCLVNAWGTNDYTILNLIQTLLNNSCALQGQIDAIDTALLTFDPMITVEWKCCSTAPCVISPSIKVSEAIQSIIDCICLLKADVTSLTSRVAYLEGRDRDIALQISAINSVLTPIAASMPCIRGWTLCS
jgi:hypothetical protein